MLRTNITFREFGTIAVFLVSTAAFSQSQSVAIGTTSVDTDAVLLLVGNGQQGLIIPTTTDIAQMPKKSGMVVYLTVDKKVYYCDGNSWASLGGGTAGTTPSLAINGNSISIFAGQDVPIAISPPTQKGQLLMWDGVKWVSTIGSTPSTNQVLQWNGSSWAPATLANTTFGNLTTTTTGLSVTGGTAAVAGSGATINIQDATANQPGLLTAADFTTFNNKLGSGSAAGGDLTGTYPNPTIGTGKILASHLNAMGATTNGQVLQWNGNAWAPATLTTSVFGNLTTTTTGLSITGGTAAVAGSGATVNIQNATASQPGLLTATDFATFNSKLSSTILTTSGDILYHDGTSVTKLARGSNGQALLATASGIQWSNLPGGGDMLKSTYDANSDGIVDVAASVNLGSQTANTVLASPNGSAGTPTFRSLVAADFPNFDVSKLSTGVLGVARGGTNSSATPTNGGVAFGNGTAYAFTSAGTAGQILQSNGAAAPTWINAPGATGTAGGDLTGNYPNPTIGLGKVTSTYIFDGTILDADIDTNAGIVGTKVNPAFGAQSLTVGATSQFTVNTTGNITKINNITTSFPSTQGVAGTVLTNNGSGTLSWAAVASPFTTANTIPKGNGTTLTASSIFDDGAGHVGVGTTTPGSGLEVSGAAPYESAIGIKNSGGGTDWRIVSNTDGSLSFVKIPGATITALSFTSTGGVGFAGLYGSAGQVLTSNGANAAPTWTTISGGGNMISTNNLSDVSNVATARANLGLGALATLGTVTTAEITNATITGADLAGSIAISTTGNIAVSAPGTITGIGSGITSLNATNISSGTLALARISPSATPGDVLTTVGGVPVWQAPVTGTTTLDGLTDATVTTPTAGQLLVYNGTTDFKNSSLTGDIASISSSGVVVLTNSASTRTNLGLGTLATLGTITTAEITNATIAAADMANSSVVGGTGGVIQDASITAADLSSMGASNGQVLTFNSGAWAPLAAVGFTNPMTTAGDIIYGGVSGVATRLAGGATGILKSNGTTPTWGSVNLASTDVSGILPVANGGTNSTATPTNGGVAYGTGTAYAFTTAGTAGQILQSNGAAAPTWVAKGWGLTGNTGTSPATNFIGTTDAQDFRIRTNNLDRVSVSSNGFVGIGTLVSNSAPNAKLEVVNGSGPALMLNGGNANNNAYMWIGRNGGNDVELGVAATAGFLNTQTAVGDVVLRNGNGSKLMLATSAVTPGLTVLGQNVGFGTINPTELIDVSGPVLLEPTTVPSTPTHRLYNIGGSLFWNGTNISSGGVIAGNGLSVTGSTVNLGGTMANSITTFTASTDNIFEMISSNAALSTKAGLNLRMDAGYTGRQYEVIARKSDATANSGSSDFLINTLFSTAGGYIESFKVDGGTSDVSINGAKTSASAYGNFLVPNGNVGIGTTSPTTKLEIAGSIKIVDGTQGTGKVLTSDANGLATWQTAGGGSGWGLLGNAVTVDGTNFIGTTDNIPLSFRVNNQLSGRIDPTLVSTFFGYQAGLSNTGVNNVGFGNYALFFNTSGTSNTATGRSALYQNTTGNNNIAFGQSALLSNSTGSDNSGMGYQAIYANTTGAANTAYGSTALTSNTVGNLNTALGYSALRSNVAGSNGTAIGMYAMGYVNNTTSPFTNTSTAVGFQSLMGSITASSNTGVNGTALGYQSLMNNTSGNDNTALGYAALVNNSQGSQNTSAGSGALQSNTTGGLNTAIGYNALFLNITGNSNTAIGYYALRANTATQNTAVGMQALLNNTTGTGNIAIGFNTGSNNTTGSTNILLGDGANVNSASLSNAIAIGAGTVVAASNSIQLGNGAITTVNVGGASTTLVVNGLQITGGILSAGKVLTSDATGNATWQAAGAGTGWSLSGNTAVATDYIGTNNAFPFNIKVNNIKSGTIDPTLLNTYFGYQSGKVTTGSNNTGLGYNSLSANVSGADNTAVGYKSMESSTNSNGNTALGRSSLFTLSFANGGTAYSLYNTAVGYQALYLTNPATAPLEAYHNTALGYDAGHNNTTGYKNTFIGATSGPASGTLSNATAIGYNAQVGASNSLVLGGTGADAVNVGIGTTTPSATLEVVGQIKSASTSADGISGTASTASTAGVIGVNDVANGWGVKGSSSVGIGVYGVSTSSYGVYGASSGATGVYGVGIGSGIYGVYGINDVSGGYGVYGKSASGYAGYFQGNVSIQGNLSISGGTGQLNPVLDNVFILGTSTQRWTTVYATNGTINTSDKRLKRNITNLNYGLKEIKNLRPVSFYWKDTKGSKKLGFIAQEVLETLPEVVDVPEKGFMGINYSDIIPVTVKAIQEQQAMIEKQQAEIEILKAKLDQFDAFKAEFESLKARVGAEASNSKKKK